MKLGTPEDPKFSTEEYYRKVLSGIDTVEAAIKALHLHPLVIERFPEITLDQVRAEARRASQGDKYVAMVPVEDDSETAKLMIEDVVTHWIRDSLFDKNPTVRKFWQRMYLESNPDGYSQEGLERVRKEFSMKHGPRKAVLASQFKRVTV